MLEAPAGHIRQIERGGAGAPNAVRAQRELVVEVNVRVVVSLAAGESVATNDSAKSGVREAVNGRPLRVAPRPRSAQNNSSSKGS